MDVMIGGERVTRLTDLRRRSKEVIDELKEAKNHRVVLTTHGEPVAVLQEYRAYQEMLKLIEQIEHELHLAKFRERLQAMNEGEVKSIPLEQVMAKYGAPDDNNVSG